MADHGEVRGEARTDLISGGIAPRRREIDVALVTGAGANWAFLGREKSPAADHPVEAAMSPGILRLPVSLNAGRCRACGSGNATGVRGFRHKWSVQGSRE